MTGGNVNDAEPAMTESDATINEEPLVVGTSVLDHVAHPLKHARVDLAP
jgi:hypothetical protein